MNDYKQQHLEKKQNVSDCLVSAEKFLTENNYVNEADVVHQQNENLLNGEFTIAVVGEFSAGKSTFLNALMGEKLLPSFTKETTATINFLQHTDRAVNGVKGIVHYNDGRQECLQKADAETISKYVSTNSEEDVAKNIGRLDLYLESRFLEDNVTLVDTPGLNGVADGHREITQDQIEKSSAGIFMFNANQPGSKSDFEFLNGLRKHVKNIILVLNQIDNIKSSEGETVESVIESLKKNYKNNVDGVTTVPEIMPVSAYLALLARSSTKMEYQGKTVFSETEKQKFEDASRMKDFEDRLWRYLTQGEKAKQELLAPLEQLEAQLSDIEKRLTNEQEVLNGSIDQDEIDEQICKLQESILKLEEKHSDETKSMRESIQSAERDFNEQINGECEQLRMRYSNRIEKFEDLDDIDPDDIQKRLKSEITRIISDSYDTFTESLRSIMLTQTENLSNEINSQFDGGLDVSITNELKLPTVEVGLEMYEAQEKQLMDEINKLKEEADICDGDYKNQLIIQAKKNNAERELKRLKDERNVYEENSYVCAPSIQHFERSVEKKTGFKDKGLLGELGMILFGSKPKVVIEQVVDSTERDKYLAHRDRILLNRDNEIKKLEAEAQKYASVDPEQFRIAMNKKEKCMSEKQKELIVLQTEFSTKVKKQNAVMLRKQISQVRDYIDDCVSDTKKHTRKTFNKQRDALESIMSNMVADSIRKQIELKKQELTTLKQHSDMAVAEKNSQLETIKTQLGEITCLRSKAYSIKEEIDSIETDIITEEDV